MARRKRLTKTKKSRIIGGDPDAPADAEWKTMVRYGSFVVSDQDDTEHTFKVGDTATILPDDKDASEDVELWEYWVGKIRDIRIRGPVPDVWVRVQWYWSPSEVANIIKSFDSSACGKRERLLSDHYDLVSSLCFSGLTTVKKYRDDDLEPDHIRDTDFYVRYTLEHKVRKVDPKPASTCICERPYNPEDDTMHFCPRPGCCSSYHRSCLVDARAKDTNISDRGLRLLACSPDTDGDFSLTDLTSEDAARRRRRNTEPAPQTAAELLSSLPADLVKVAQQPIVKGAKAGVVGNVEGVVRARRMIYQAIGEKSAVPDDWDQTIDASLILSPVSGQKVPALLCPKCQSPI